MRDRMWVVPPLFSCVSITHLHVFIVFGRHWIYSYKFTKHQWNFIKILFYSEINSILNVKNNEFSFIFYTYFPRFLTRFWNLGHCMKYVHGFNSLNFSQCENNSFDKITACEDITFIPKIKPGISRLNVY